MSEVRMSLALWVAQNAELWRDGDDARNGFIALNESPGKCRRWRALVEIGTGEGRCFATSLLEMVRELQSSG